MKRSGIAGIKALAGAFARYAGRRGMAAGVLVGLGAVLESFGLLLLVPLLGVVIGGGEGGGRWSRALTEAFAVLGFTTAAGRLSALLGLFAVLMVLRAIVIHGRDIRLAELRIGFVEDRRRRIVDCLAEARWSALTGLRHARISHVMSGDIQRIAIAATFLLQSATAAVMLAVQAVLAFLLSPALALVAFVLMAVMGAILLPMIRRARDMGGFVTGANLSLLDTTTQFLGGLKLAVSQNLQASFTSEFRATLTDLTQRQIANLRENSLGRLALTTLSALMAALLVLIGFVVFHLAAPVLIALLAVIARMSGPVGQIQQGLQQLAFALPAYEAVEVLERDLRRVRRPTLTGPTQGFPTGAIVFEAVSFHHADGEGAGGGDRRGVEAISLSLAPGECLGIAGPSGAGKTTFLDLLAGLLSPQAGRIMIGGAALEGAVLIDWRESLAYVSQDPFLFHDSVRRNLAWAAPSADEAAMWEALELAGAEALVKRLPHGLDTVVGERGSLLSGGERQRLALARALLRRPRLLLLDEATNAIDIDGERAILGRLMALRPRPTIVIVAHRRESLALCDRVIEFGPAD